VVGYGLTALGASTGAASVGAAGVALTSAGMSGLGLSPLTGTRYTQKVQTQLERDKRHGFPMLIDEEARYATVRPLRGNDRSTKTLVSLSGAVNCTSGAYEWIINPDRTINHRFFNPTPM
jgi:hypothetical protein